MSFKTRPFLGDTWEALQKRIKIKKNIVEKECASLRASLSIAGLKKTERNIKSRFWDACQQKKILNNLIYTLDFIFDLKHSNGN